MAATAAIAAAGVYVLLFTRWALPELAHPFGGGAAWRLRQVMLWLAFGGGLGSILGAWRFRLVAYQRMLGWSFRAAAAVAALALLAPSWPVILTTALLAGAASGWLAVVLTAGLRASAGTARLGLRIGAGLGVAFLVSGLIEAFGGTARAATIIAALVAATGSLAGPFLTPVEPSVSPLVHYKPAGLLRWSLVFVGLVGLVAVLAAAPGGSVGAPAWLAAGGAVAGSAAAGWALDRDWTVGVAGVALGLLLVAALAGAGSLAASAGALARPVPFVAMLHYAARGGRVRPVMLLAVIAGWGALFLATATVTNAPQLRTELALGAAALAAAGVVWRPRA